MKKVLRIGTRASLLAMTQSTWVKECIEALLPQTQVELVQISTQGDRILDVPLAKIGGKGLFVKEIEEALLDGRVDLAVHSMKDVPTVLPEGLHIGIMPARELPWDAFISACCTTPAELPQGARVGTSSLRRKAQLAALRPDLQILDLRGNVDTRLRKLDEGQYEAILLAGAGLKRLGLQERITSLLTEGEMLPAIAQGALGLELRTADTKLLAALQPLHDPETAAAVTAERALLQRLEGGCQTPIAAYAMVLADSLRLTGLIASIDGKKILKSQLEAPLQQAATLGRTLAETLLAQGGKAILEAIYAEHAAQATATLGSADSRNSSPSS